MRTHLTFETQSFPDDADFDAAGDIARPGGLNIALALVDLLARKGIESSKPVQHSFYGWAFTVGGKQEVYFILQFAEPWLLLTGLQGNMAGPAGEAAANLQCRLLTTLHEALNGDRRFGGLTWYAREEYERGDPGWNDPGCRSD